MEFLMILRIFFVSALVIWLLTGCTKKFKYNRTDEIPATAWQYVRYNQQGQAAIPAEYKGGLNVKWETGSPESPIGPPSLGAGMLIHSGSKGKLFFYSLSNHKFLGRLKIRGASQAGVVTVDSLAYLAVGPSRNHLVCLNLFNQKPLWRASLKDVTGQPIILENRLYVGSAGGDLHCLDRLTGEEIWRKKMPAKSLAGPSLNDSLVYFPCDNGELRCFNALTGDSVFTTDLRQPLLSKAAVGDRIYISGADGGFFAIDKLNGQVVWKSHFDWPIWTSPAVDDSAVYIADNGGIVRALNKRDGALLWEFKTGGVVIASPIVVGDFLLLASLDRFVYCLNKRTGIMNSRRELKSEIRFPLVSDGRGIYAVAHDGSIFCFGD